MANITLTATAPSDYWRKPPDLDVATAPTYVQTIPVSKFHRARATITATWSRLYDQGGLIVLFPAKTKDGKQFWLKTGIEQYDGHANVSTVAAREWADWSLLPLPNGQTSVTVEIEREPVVPAEGKGSSLWVYVVNGETKKAVREITWAFEGFDDEAPLNVGLYAARPTVDGGGDPLAVNFESFIVE